MKRERYEFAKYEKYAGEHGEKVFVYSVSVHGNYPIRGGYRGDLAFNGHLTAKSIADAKRQITKHYNKKYPGNQRVQIWSVKQVKK